MKIPENIKIWTGSALCKSILEYWSNQVLQIGINYGVFVQVKKEASEDQYLTRIYLEGLDREFESVADLVKVLNLKAFL